MDKFKTQYDELINEIELNPLKWNRTTQHVGLGLAGFIPYVGLPADMTNAVMYYQDGDKIGYWISVISMIPVGDMVKILTPYKQLAGPIKSPGAIRVIMYFLKKGAPALSKSLQTMMKGLLRIPKIAKITKKLGKFIVNGVIDERAVAEWADGIANGFLRWCNSKLDPRPLTKRAKNGRYVSNEPGRLGRFADKTAQGAEKIMNPRLVPFKGFGNKLGLAGDAYLRTYDRVKWAREHPTQAQHAQDLEKWINKQTSSGRYSNIDY